MVTGWDRHSQEGCVCNMDRRFLTIKRRVPPWIVGLGTAQKCRPRCVHPDIYPAGMIAEDYYRSVRLAEIQDGGWPGEPRGFHDCLLSGVEIPPHSLD